MAEPGEQKGGRFVRRAEAGRKRTAEIVADVQREQDARRNAEYAGAAPTSPERGITDEAWQAAIKEYKDRLRKAGASSARLEYDDGLPMTSMHLKKLAGDILNGKLSYGEAPRAVREVMSILAEEGPAGTEKPPVTPAHTAESGQPIYPHVDNARRLTPQELADIDAAHATHNGQEKPSDPQQNKAGGEKGAGNAFARRAHAGKERTAVAIETEQREQEARRNADYGGETLVVGRPDSPTETPTRPPETVENREMAAGDIGLTPEGRYATAPERPAATPEQMAEAERAVAAALGGAEAVSQEQTRAATPEERNMLRGMASWWRRQSTWKKITVGVLLGVGGVAAYAAGGWAGHAAAALLYGTSRGLSFLSGFAITDSLTERMRSRYGAGALSIAGGVAMAFAIPSLVNFLNSEFGVGDKIGRWLGFSGESAGTGKPPVDPGAKGPGVPEKSPGIPGHPVSVEPGDGPSTLIERALYAQGMAKADVNKLVYELQGKLIKVHDTPAGLKWEIIASPEKLREWGIDPAVFEGVKTAAWQTNGKTLDLTRMLADPAVRVSLPKDVTLPDFAPNGKVPDAAPGTGVPEKVAPEKGIAATDTGLGKGGGGISAQITGAPLEGAIQSGGPNAPIIPEGSAEGTITEAQRAALERQREILTFEHFRSGIREAFGGGGFLSFLFGGDSGARLFNLHDWRTASEFINATTLPNITARALHTAQEYLSENARALGINLDGLTVRRAIEAIAEGKAGKEL